MNEYSRPRAVLSAATDETAALPAPIRDPGIWGADDHERELAAELEKVLRLKPVARLPDAMFVRGNSDDDHIEDEQLDTGKSSDDRDGDENLGFSWQQTSADSDPAPELARNDASLQWVNKARSDRRRRLARTIMAWATALSTGLGIVAGAAYLLLGWQPDFSALWATLQPLWS